MPWKEATTSSGVSSLSFWIRCHIGPLAPQRSSYHPVADVSTVMRGSVTWFLTSNMFLSWRLLWALSAHSLQILASVSASRWYECLINWKVFMVSYLLLFDCILTWSCPYRHTRIKVAMLTASLLQVWVLCSRIYLAFDLVFLPVFFLNQHKSGQPSLLLLLFPSYRFLISTNQLPLNLLVVMYFFPFPHGIQTAVSAVHWSCLRFHAHVKPFRL